jgi:hypothetical protein
MSRAMKPRKSAPLFGWAPWPRIAMTGPWFTGSLPGFEVSKALPGFGSVRRAAFVSEPRHEVSAVAKKSMNSVSLPGHGFVAPAVGPGRLTYRRTATGRMLAFVITRA